VTRIEIETSPISPYGRYRFLLRPPSGRSAQTVAHLPDRENPSDLLAIVLELPGPDIMRRPPFRPKESIFARGLGFYIVRIGIIFAISQYRPNARGGKPLRRGWRVENDGFYYPLSRADRSRDLLSIERSSSNRDESPR
jgi:hypothetical protein